MKNEIKANFNVHVDTTEVDELIKKLKKANSLVDELTAGNTILDCGTYKDYRLVSKYGSQLDLPESYQIIILKNHH
ncbi:hypothetical protein [Companilactobacillus sp.]|uniref:hypothetical protein n=1 Tax=Companilactobacillus sp. TaxID=2767905 RepID=UPI0026185FFF|nr:hypothetical protein [Companilactobacillus sp.]